MSDDSSNIQRVSLVSFREQDIVLLRSKLPRLGYQEGDRLEDVAYRQGHHDCLNWIERCFKGK